MKILHIAPQNFAGVPYDYFRMHNDCGDESRLVTLHKNQINFPEDICLDLPLPKFKLAAVWRRNKSDLEAKVSSVPKYFGYKNSLEKLYFNFSDKLREKTVFNTKKKYNLDDFQIIHLDGGLGFFRNSKQILEWKRKGKKIVCCYYGSDLRMRGLIREIDQISDLNLTSEYDHLSMKSDLHYLFYPYDSSELPKRKQNTSDKLKIVHSPTNRKYKGTELILEVISGLENKFNFEFILLENLPREEVLQIKSGCDICIDQVGGAGGGTGYGKAGLESLAMGIPTVINMTEEYMNWMPENPFVIANNADDLRKQLILLFENSDLRKEFSEKGIAWVEKYHGYSHVNAKLRELYKSRGVI